MNEPEASNLAKVINIAISLAEEFVTFTLDQFNAAFIAAMKWKKRGEM